MLASARGARVSTSARPSVFLTSDNGGLSTSEGSPDLEPAATAAGKGWLYEGGVREPTIVHWPGVTRPGTISDSVVTSPDFLPTLLEACGLPPVSTPIDGVSFVPTLRGAPQERGPIFWHYPHYGNQGGSPGAAVRDGDLKLVLWFETDHVELYDLARDPEEAHDLAAERTDDVVRLRAALAVWQADVGASYPTQRQPPPGKSQ